MRGFYAIVDPELCGDRDPRLVARQILEGGCAVLQLRAKRMQGSALTALAGELAALCRQAQVPFVINDHVALALEVGAWGAHLGQHDMPLGEARRIGPTLALGLSTHDLSQAERAAGQGADLIGFGPVFATRSKARPDPVVGVDALRAVCRAAPQLPVVAIGGIGLAELPTVIATGVPLVAAIGAVCSAEDPAAAARTFHGAVRGGAWG